MPPASYFDRNFKSLKLFLGHAISVLVILSLSGLVVPHANAQVTSTLRKIHALPNTSSEYPGSGSGTWSLHTLPDAPSESQNVPGNISTERKYYPQPAVRDLGIESYEEPKIVDRQFLLLNAFQLMAMVADTETSVYQLSSGGKELNPLLRNHPTRAKYYSIGVPLTALGVYLSYHYKRLSPDRGFWKAFPLALTAGHSAGTLFNVLQ